MFNKIKNLFHKKNKESDIAIQDEENIKPANKPCTCPEEISSQYYGPFCPRCFGTRLQYYAPYQQDERPIDAALLLNTIEDQTTVLQQIEADPSFSGFASGDSGGAGASDDYGSGAYTCTDSSVSCGTDSSLSCDTSSTDSSCADSGNF